ncbi:MAG: prolyl oligopeptidase family serine peptidase [Acidobacteria bacterium]|nr:prolyl oligopeptidase family serine peptidase [Acidobacteriota bacterium]
MKNSINLHALAALSVAFLLLQQTLIAQPTPTASSKKFELTVDSIMRGAALVGYEPGSVRWSQDGARVYFRWKQATEARLKEMDTYVVNRDGTGLRKLSEEEAKNAPPASGELSKDKRWTVFAEEGDVYLYEHARAARRPLTRTTEAETNPHFTRDGRRVYFTRQNNLYVLSLDGGGLLEQLTDIRVGGGSGGGGGQPERGTESQEVLKKEERALLEAVRERAERREEQEAKRKARERRKPFNIPTGQTVSNLTLSPDGRFVVAVITEPAPAAKQTIVPNYVTESAYTQDIPGRTKVGDAQGRTRMAVISVETGDARNVEHGQRAEAAPIVRTRTEQNATEQAGRERGADTQQQTQQGQAQQAQTQQQTQGQQQQQQQGQQPPRTQTETTAQTGAQARERDVQLFQLQWSEDGSRAAMLARSADNKDRWVLLLDPATGKTKTLAALHDDAWANGPGAFTLGWLPDNRRVYFESEQDGFAHLYTVSIDGGSRPVQLTRGAFEVSDVRLSEDKSKFYFTSSEVSFAERHLYSMPVAGGARPTRLTALPGNNAADISPDERMLAIVRSYSNKPPELYLAASAPMSDARQVTTSPIPEFFTHNWIEPPIVAVRARDGATVQARLYKPARPNGAAVLFVHGAGYLQNVHRWWSNYYREYMFHHLLMERGYTVLDIDYRGSAGYGRDWRTGIYRHMGGKDLTDHVDAARYLSAEHNIDPKRIGIYGGSYGGFITLMAMFTTPDVFAAGAALRPVTDWAHYNHPYTSNILNLPQTDLEAYKRSSPIYFAEGLRGALLICHGMVDVNVHFQDSVRLAQRLIELRKENWELAAYPVEDHAFERDTSWADEYKRILKLFTENLHPDAAGASPVGQGVDTRRR